MEEARRHKQKNYRLKTRPSVELDVMIDHYSINDNDDNLKCLCIHKPIIYAHSFDVDTSLLVSRMEKSMEGYYERKLNK